MFGFLKRIKVDASWKLLCYLLYYGHLEVTVTFKEVSDETGIKSRTSYIAAREELVKHGIIEVEKKGHAYVIRLTGQRKPTEPVFVAPELTQEPESPTDPWEEKIQAIEAMVEGNQKKASQVKFLIDAFKEYFPEYHAKHPISIASVKTWLAIEPSLRGILEMVQDIAQRPNVSAPPSYISGALRRRKTEVVQQAPTEEQEWPEDPKVAKGRDLLKRFKVTVPSLLDRGFGDD